MRETPPKALLFALVAFCVVPACSMTEDMGEYSLRYELCRDADTENMDCPLGSMAVRGDVDGTCTGFGDQQ